MKLTTIILSIVSVALAVALVAVHYTKGSQLKETRAEYARVTTQWDQARGKIEDSGRLVEVLQGDLASRSAALTALSNELAKVQAELAKSGTDLASAKTDLTKRDARIAELDKQVAQLETERDDLSKRMADLTGQIDGLENQITETKRKLEMADGDRTYLLAELKRLQEDKSALVAQFNSLATLRTQIAKLREEAAIKQRLAWMRSGVYARQDMKGAERLFARSPEPAAAPNNRLDVELERNGAGRATVPPAGQTSAQ